ncbi:MAG TPA: hypothetical protein VF867_09985 [Arthrobacter sp.]
MLAVQETFIPAGAWLKADGTVDITVGGKVLDGGYGVNMQTAIHALRRYASQHGPLLMTTLLPDGRSNMDTVHPDGTVKKYDTAPHTVPARPLGHGAGIHTEHQNGSSLPPVRQNRPLAPAEGHEFFNFGPAGSRPRRQMPPAEDMDFGLPPRSLAPADDADFFGLPPLKADHTVPGGHNRPVRVDPFSDRPVFRPTEHAHAPRQDGHMTRPPDRGLGLQRNPILHPVAVTRTEVTPGRPALSVKAVALERHRAASPLMTLGFVLVTMLLAAALVMFGPMILLHTGVWDPFQALHGAAEPARPTPSAP